MAQDDTNSADRDPRTGRFTKGNQACPRGNIRAEVHGVNTLIRRGPTPAQTQMLAGFRERCIQHLGGEDAVSTLERHHVEHLATVHLMIVMLEEYLVEHGPLTPRGRQRSSVAALTSLVGLYNKIAKTLGLQRRQRNVTPSIEDFLNSQEDPE